MKKSHIVIAFQFTSVIFGCDIKLPQIANNPPSSLFSFGFKGRLEKLEDAFYKSNFSYAEFNYATHKQTEPEYEFIVKRKDTVLKYVVILQDCQSIYYLVTWNDNWNCDSSYIHIDRFSSNIDSIPQDIAKSIFKKEIIQRLEQEFKSLANDYHWKIEKTKDTTYVKILNQNNILRKLYKYSFDSIGNSVSEKEIFNYLGDSTIYYRNSQSQRFVYLESKKVIRSNRR